MTDVQTETKINQMIDHALMPLRERIEDLERDAQTQKSKEPYEIARHIIGYLERNCGLSFFDVKQDDWDAITNLVATLGLSDTRPLRPDGADDLEHLDGMLDDRERG